MKATVFLVCLIGFSAIAQDIIFTNRFATFASLDGKSYTNVQVVRADSYGVIYRERKTGNGGRICFTNLAPATLEYLNVPTNRIDAYNSHLMVLKAEAEATEIWRAKLVEQAAADARIESSSQTIEGKVIQRVGDEGLLIQLEGYVGEPTILLTDYPTPKMDDDRIRTKAYLIGSYQYVSVLGATKTVRKYTFSKVVAKKFLERD